ncbi:MAG: type II CRISPR RNA-guided endonuclease Cas9 [Bacteroidota bacterium]
MAKILGLDLGTNSIGWAVVNEEKKPHQYSYFSLLEKGVHIFSEGVKNEKGNESSKAAERTKFRSARRLKFRRKLRKYETLKVLLQNNMCPLTLDELEKWHSFKEPTSGKIKSFKHYPQSEFFLNWLHTDNEGDKEQKKQAIKNPYYFRAKAISEKITPYQLGRALYHLAQRRGFLSNRLEQSDENLFEELKKQILDILESENELNAIKEEIDSVFSNLLSDDVEDDKASKTQKAISKVFKDKNISGNEQLKETIKKILNKKENLGDVAKGIKDLSQEIESAGCKTMGQYFYKLYQENGKIRKRYTSREEHYLAEFENICNAQQLDNKLIEELKRAIFFQRPLKSQKGLVGNCSFEKNKPRSPISHPAFEEYRTLSFINNIKYKKSKEEDFTFLDEEQKKKIYTLFLRKSKPNFDFIEIREELTPKNLTWEFNYTDRTNVSGCPTISQLKNVFGINWENEIYNRYTLKNFKKKQGTKSKEEVINDIWHVLFTFDNNDKLKVFAKEKLGCDEKTAIKFSNIRLKRDYGQLSLNAIKKILPYLREGQIFTYAVFLANMEEVVGKEIWNNKVNQAYIRDGLKIILDIYSENKKKETVVNELMYYFKNNSNNAHRSYSLTAKDKEDVQAKILEVFGDKTFQKFKADKQTEIEQWIESAYQEQLRKAEYIKPKRLDEIIGDFLIRKFDLKNEQLKKLYHPSDIDIYKKSERDEDGKTYLGSPIISSIKNPMAMRALHQLRKLVNTLIEEETIDENTRIHIELARNLNDANKRRAIKRYQDERREDREQYREEIKQLYKEECQQDIEPTEDEILKYQLWIEQNKLCVYTGDSIGICDFIGGNPKYDIEHTLPRSDSQDNSQMNKTLANLTFNRQVKSNKTPFDLGKDKLNEILPRIHHWKTKAEENEKLYNERKKARGLETKEQKDKRIQEKHYYKMHFDYWKGKYDRFLMEEIPKGFKNSQIVDTGIITKYARAYLKSVFGTVQAVKGDMTYEFRKIWGLQGEYEKKERANHIHHCIDAITIACMTKDKYDILASAYEKEEENRIDEAKEILNQSKPWGTFVEDLKTIENEVLVSHYTPDNVKKQTKKKLKKRGKVVLDENGKPIYLQGDTVRGSLHKETFYGAIKRKEENGNEKIFYVLRTELSKLDEGDIKNIVDEVVKEKIKKAVEDKGFKKAMSEPIWMNEEKKIQIKKVRCLTPSVSSPLPLKEHRDKSKHGHKQHYNVTNDENYCMAIYEGKDKKGKIKRDSVLINYLDAGDHFKLSNKSYRKQFPFVEKVKDGLQLKVIIRKGQMVLLYDKEPDEIWNLTEEKKLERLYEITQLDVESSGIKLLYHQEAREKKEITTHMGLKTGMKGGKLIDKFKEYPWIKVSPNQFDALIEGIDFTLSPTGKITKL